MECNYCSGLCAWRRRSEFRNCQRESGISERLESNPLSELLRCNVYNDGFPEALFQLLGSVKLFFSDNIEMNCLRKKTSVLAGGKQYNAGVVRPRWVWFDVMWVERIRGNRHPVEVFISWTVWSSQIPILCSIYFFLDVCPLIVHVRITFRPHDYNFHCFLWMSLLTAIVHSLFWKKKKKRNVYLSCLVNNPLMQASHYVVLNFDIYHWKKKNNLFWASALHFILFTTCKKKKKPH